MKAPWLAGLLVGLVVLSGCATKKDFGQLDSASKWREALQPALSEDAATSLTRGASLGDALALALTRNPGVQAQRLRWLASINIEPQAKSLPDPMVQFGYQFDSVETRVGPQRWNAGVSQRLPWWQKLWAQGQVAASLADIQRLRYEAAARDLVIEVKDSWYELYYLDQAQAITESIEQVLRNEALVAYTELEGGRTQLGEAFRAEAQAAQLAYDRILLTEQREAQAERLRSLLNLPPGTEIGPVRSAPAYSIDNNLENLYGRAETYSQILKIRGLEIQKAEYDTYLAKLSRIPDITAGVNYIQTDSSRMTGAARPNDSGKDPFIGIVSFNLPIWENRTRALIREKEAVEEAMKNQALEEANRTRKAVAQAWFQVRLTDRLERLYGDTLLPQAQSVMNQAEIDFRAEQSSFSNVIETTLAYHNFLLAWHRAVADHGQAIGRLEKALGTTAEPRPDETSMEDTPPGTEITRADGTAAREGE